MTDLNRTPLKSLAAHAQHESYNSKEELIGAILQAIEDSQASLGKAPKSPQVASALANLVHAHKNAKDLSKRLRAASYPALP